MSVWIWKNNLTFFLILRVRKKNTKQVKPIINRDQSYIYRFLTLVENGHKCDCYLLIVSRRFNIKFICARTWVCEDLARSRIDYSSLMSQYRTHHMKKRNLLLSVLSDPYRFTDIWQRPDGQSFAMAPGTSCRRIYHL